MRQRAHGRAVRGGAARAATAAAAAPRVPLAQGHGSTSTLQATSELRVILCFYLLLARFKHVVGYKFT